MRRRQVVRRHIEGARLHGIEQRPVALLQRISFRKRRPQLQPERTQHAIVAIIALQHDARERRRRRAARWRGIPWPPPRAVPRRDQTSGIPARRARWSSAVAYHRGVAAERRDDVGLDRCVVGAGHIVFAAGGNDHARRQRADRRAGAGVRGFADMAISIEQIGEALLHLVGDVERNGLDRGRRVHAA